MGMPKITIEFTHKAETVLQRGQRGVVAVILADDTKAGEGYTSYSISSETDIVKSHWSTANLDYISLIFKGLPKKVLIERISTGEGYTGALARLKNKKWNWLTVPGIDTDDVSTVADWIAEMRDGKKSFKAVLANYAADNRGVVNFATDTITVGGKTYTGAEYCARIAGVLAGTALTESATYKVLSEVTSITESVTPDEDINAGKLILVNDGENIKIGRAVNSMVTVNDNEIADQKKIKIVELMDMIYEDIRETFEKAYMGRANSYDNKQLFISALNQYFKGLAEQGLLEENDRSFAEIDVEAQREWLILNGTNAEEMTDAQVKTAKTGSYIFLTGALSLIDAVEDLSYKLYI